MESQMEKFLHEINKMNEKLDEVKNEFAIQTTILTNNFTKLMSQTIEEKLNPFVEENRKLKKEVGTLTQKVHKLEREVRKNNIVLHGVEEIETNRGELLEIVLTALNDMACKADITKFDMWEISEVRRLGNKIKNNKRPILIRFTLEWRKYQVLKNNKSLGINTYATEDFPMEVLEIRKDLKAKQKEEKEKGNTALIRYDKLIVLKPRINQERGNEKRKRSPSNSPTNGNQEGNEIAKTAQKITKTNAFEYMNRNKNNPSPGTSSKQ